MVLQSEQNDKLAEAGSCAVTALIDFSAAVRSRVAHPAPQCVLHCLHDALFVFLLRLRACMWRRLATAAPCSASSTEVSKHLPFLPTMLARAIS